jgi:hypothetical protein
MLTSKDLANMRQVNVSAMMCTGVIMSASATINSYGEEIFTYTAGNPIFIGLDMRPGSERQGNKNIITEYDATARMSITQTPNVKDQLKVTKRFGEKLDTPLTFEIVSPIQRGPSGIRVMLKKVNV